MRMATMPMMPTKAMTAVLAMALCGGCVQRTISITSQPAGALVYLNDEEVGRTPIEVPFTFYGTYDVRLERDGYAPLWTQQKAEPPWWEYPGPDLFAEAVPGAKSKLAWHFELDALPAPEDRDADALAQRARELRQTLSDTPVPPELEPQQDQPQEQPQEQEQPQDGQ